MDAQLAAALEAWAESRDVAAADRVDALTLEALAGWEPPTARTAVAFQAAWLAAAASVAHRGWAADSLLVKLPAENLDSHHDKQRRNAEALAVRFDALAAAGPDPRVARGIVRVLVRWSLLLQFHDATAAACTRAILPSLDARTAAELRELAATCNHIPQRARVEAIVSEAPVFAAVTPAPAAASSDAAELSSLWAHLRAQPVDDAPRRVLADALQQRGDPRGELFALQLADADPARVATLIKTHGHAWLGALARFAERVQFARGCVARIELASAGALTKPGWRAARDEPELATVEDLLPGTANAQVYADMLTAPALVGLRRITVYDRLTAVALGALPPRLVHVAFRWMRGNPAKPFTTEVLPRLLAHPLDTLTLPLAAFDALAASPLLGRLRSVIIAGELPDVLALWPRLPSTASLTCQPTAELAPCSNIAPTTSWVTLARDGKGVVVRTNGARADELFDALPAKVARLELVDRTPDDLPRAARKRGIEVVEVSSPKLVGALVVR